MTQPPADPARGKAVSDLDRTHVFHSWSAQSQISPLPVAGGAALLEGFYVNLDIDPELDGPRESLSWRLR